MAEVFPEIIEGPLDTEAEITECIVDGAVPQWSPVVLKAAGTGEDLPRIGTSATAGDPKKYGVKVWPNRTLVAGDVCWVVTRGRSKMKINEAVSRGDAMGISAVAGKGAKITALDAPAAYVEADVQTELNKLAATLCNALMDGAADGDIIVVDVQRSAIQK